MGILGEDVLFLFVFSPEMMPRLAFPPRGVMRAVVSKRGVDDGNQKGGGFLQPAQESHFYYNPKKTKRKKNLKKYFGKIVKLFLDFIWEF